MSGVIQEARAARGRRSSRLRGTAVGVAALVLAGGLVAAIRSTGPEPVSVVRADDLPAGGAGGTGTTDPLAPIDPAALDRTAQVVSIAAGPGGAPVLSLVGTAPPGETVEASTRYGSATTESTGAWSLALELPGVPAGPSTVDVTFSGVVMGISLEFDVPPALGADATDATDASDATDVTAVTAVEAAPTTEAPVEVASAAPPATAPPAAAPPSSEPTSTQPPDDDTLAMASPAPLTVTLGWTEGDGTPLDVGLWGTAPAGATITAASAAGTATTIATGDGTWEVVLRLDGLTPGQRMPITLSSSAGGPTRELSARAPGGGGAGPATFTAALGAADLSANPMRQRIIGTGTPGAAVRAQTQFGSADAVVAADGRYEIRLLMAGVPVGAPVRITVTGTSGGGTAQFDVTRAAPPAGFTANAEIPRCGNTALANDYWGTATPGTGVTVTSPYGEASAAAAADGTWAVRIDHSAAPAGEAFLVIVRAAGGSTYTLPFICP